MGRFVSELEVRVRGDNDRLSVELLAPLGYRHVGKTTLIPRGFESDLDSTPKVLRSLFASWWKYARPAVLHDWRYRSQDRSRLAADLEFYRTLREVGVWWRAPIMLCGVRVGGWWGWRKWRRRGSVSDSET